MRGFEPGRRVRLTGTERTGTVTSFVGQPVTVVYDDEPAAAELGPIASALLVEHRLLFRRAQRGWLANRQFAGAGGCLYSVGDTLRCVERELRKRGDRVLLPQESAAIDLVNILATRGEWESET